MAWSPTLAALYAAKRALDREYEHGLPDPDWHQRYARIKAEIKQEEERLKHDQQKETE